MSSEKKQSEVNVKRRKVKDNVESSSESIAGGVRVSGELMGGQEIHIGTSSGSYVGGNITTGGGDFVGRDQVKGFHVSSEIESVFKTIYKQIDDHPTLEGIDKEDLKSGVESIQNEVVKGELVDEFLLSRHLRAIYRIAPDICKVVISTMIAPSNGFSIVVQKVAHMYREKLL